jgi:hypothetical protein
MRELPTRQHIQDLLIVGRQNLSQGLACHGVKYDRAGIARGQ